MIRVPAFAERFIQTIVAPGYYRIVTRILAPYLASSRKDWILDVGCGGGDIYGSSGSFIGLDLEFDRIHSYARHRLGVVADAVRLPFRTGVLPEARCMAMLHHLPDDAARASLKEMKRVLMAEGRLLVMDGVWPRRPLLRPIAWLVDRFDAGRYFRTEEQLIDLVCGTLGAALPSRRFTHTYNGLEIIVFDWYVKPPQP